MSFLAFPVNVFVFLLLVYGIIALHLWKGNISFVRFAESKWAIIFSTLLFVITIVIAFVFQKINGCDLNFYNIFSNWYVLLATFIFLVFFGFFAIKYTSPFNINGLGKIMILWGIWISIAAVTFGSFDRKSYIVNVYDHMKNYVTQSNGEEDVLMPFVMNINKLNNQDGRKSQSVADVEFFWNNEDYDFAQISETKSYSKNGWVVALKKQESTYTPKSCKFSVVYDSWNFLVEIGLAIIGIGIIVLCFGLLRTKK